MSDPFIETILKHLAKVNSATTDEARLRAFEDVTIALEAGMSNQVGEGKMFAQLLTLILNLTSATLRMRMIQDERFNEMQKKVDEIEQTKNSYEKRLAKLETVLKEKMSDEID